MACETPYAAINLCVAMDMSGSLCSPNYNRPQLCPDCLDKCWNTTFGRETCCPNFHHVLAFSEAVIAGMDADAHWASKFSAVSFSTNATLVAPLGADAAAAGAAVRAARYAGGFTNHGAAIAACRDTFEEGVEGGDDADADAAGGGANANVILLVTDGLATWPIDSNPQAHGREAADAARDAGVRVHPVFINPEVPAADARLDPPIDYITELSTDVLPVVTEVQDFDDLGYIVADVVEAVGCAAAPPSDTTLF